MLGQLCVCVKVSCNRLHLAGGRYPSNEALPCTLGRRTCTGLRLGPGVGSWRDLHPHFHLHLISCCVIRSSKHLGSRAVSGWAARFLGWLVGLFLGVGGLAVVCWLLRGAGCSMPWLPWSCVLPTGATRFPASTLPFLMHCISMYWILLWVVCYVSGVNTMVCLSLRSLAFTPRTYLHGGIALLSASGATHGSFCQALSEFSFTRRCRWFFLCFPWTCCKWYMQLAAGDPWIQWTSFATSIFRWLRGAYHMQQCFLACAASQMVPLASLGGLMLLVFWAEVVHCSLHVLYAVLMPGKLLWAPTVPAALHSNSS